MRIAACLLALVLGLVVAMPSPAAAGSSTDAALALGSFAVLNQLLRGETVLHDLFGRAHAPRETVVIHHQPARVIYAPPPATVIYAPAPSRFVPPGHAKRAHHPGHGHGHRWHHKHGWK
jgi:hypothetical protein